MMINISTRHTRAAVRPETLGSRPEAKNLGQARRSYQSVFVRTGDTIHLSVLGLLQNQNYKNYFT
jgi:hypothetical protein